MKYINLELNPFLFFTTYDRKHSFYEDVLPSEKVEAYGVMDPNVSDLDPDEYIIKDDKVLKLTLTKNDNNSNKLKK